MNTKNTKTKILFHRTTNFKISTKVAEIVLFSLVFSASATAVFASDITPKNIESLVNNERVYRGIKPLKSDLKLEVAGTNKARDMILRNYFDHYAFGLTPWSFILDAGYNYLYAGENLAMDFDTSEGMVSAWMNSPAHRKNILNPDFNDTGVGVVKGVFTDSTGTRETTMVSNMFATKKPVVLQIIDSIIETLSRMF